MRFILLGLALVTGNGCALLEKVDWASIGKEIAVTSLAHAAASSDKFAEVLEKNNITTADIASAVDASISALSGDTEKAIETGLSALERRIPQPTTPRSPTDSPWLAVLAGGAAYWMRKRFVTAKKSDPALAATES